MLRARRRTSSRTRTPLTTRSTSCTTSAPPEAAARAAKLLPAQLLNANGPPAHHCQRLAHCSPPLPRVDRAQLERAGLLLRPFCLRRLKEDVEKSLPPRVRPRSGLASPTAL